MTEEAVVTKVGELMATLDEVKRYKSFAYAMVDFAGIVVASIIAAALILIFQDAYIVIAGPDMGQSYAAVLAMVFVVIFGVVFGVYWVRRKVRLTKVGDWKEALKEGTPGAVRLLSETDWDSTLRTINLSRAAYIFYALIKVAAYSAIVYLLLLYAQVFSGIFGAPQLNQPYVVAISVAFVLLATRRSLADGFRRMQSLDMLFWDLRVFSSDFKREFSKT